MRHTHLLATLFCLAGAIVLGGMVVPPTASEAEMAAREGQIIAAEEGAPAESLSTAASEANLRWQAPDRALLMGSPLPPYSYDYGGTSRGSGTSFVSLAAGRLAVERQTAHQKPAL